MKKIWLFGTLCLMLMCLCACMNGNEELTTSEEMTTNEELTTNEDASTNKEELWDVNQYERVEDIISIEKDLGQMSSEGVEVSTYKVKYQVDDCTVVSYLSVPDACIEEQDAYPCIIFNRGGNREFGANDS